MERTVAVVPRRSLDRHGGCGDGRPASTPGPGFVTRRPVSYDARMFAVVWHYWIGVALIVGAVATVGSLVVGYLKNVESTRYPKGR